MDLYIFCLLLGGAGLVAMAALGAGHLGGHSGSGHTGGAGGTGGHGTGGSGLGGTHAGGAHGGHAGATGYAGHAGHHLAHTVNGTRSGGARGRGDSASGTFRSTVLSLMSPRALFSVLVGFGGAGWLLHGYVGGALLFLIAVAGGVLFEAAAIRPVWNFLFRFASNPAETLEGQLASIATAASGFDAQGNGLVAVEVNGEIVQCLGTLRDDDRALGIHVHAGDQVRVEAVDTARNRCTVSYVGPADLAG